MTGLLSFWLELIDPDKDAKEGMVNIVQFAAAHSAGLEQGVFSCSEVLASFPFNLNQLLMLQENLFRQVELEFIEERVRFAAPVFEEGVPEACLKMQKTGTGK